ncbi:RNA-binding cell elongation regulator Jag/EloR [Bacillus alveayuensis]|uniref:RNA-binding protein KhpB n=1 Tax=Aeribacillus alveayuensis TaxID=279215 RepID=A0ABT9VSY0_9BACI|nr:RNA-binding cell elongation regulator Jag/EloR [Bacillus alveayuensis]MDQ0163725.1 spoIIIJ-associated protein [Bacillus alveayuensis]
MKEITSTGSTVDEAVKSALEKLKATMDEVEVRVIDEGKKGFLGIFGHKPAIVHVKLTKMEEEIDEYNPLKETVSQLIENSTNFTSDLKELEKDPADEAKKFLEEVIQKMGVSARVNVKRDKKVVYFQIEGEKLALLIGKRGQTLNSLQLLTQLVANRYSKEYIQVVLDAENYRQRRQETLSQLAIRLAEKAVQTKREIPLEPMPSFERKIIHTALVDDDRVKTYSVGRDPYRHIVIAPKDL